MHFEFHVPRVRAGDGNEIRGVLNVKAFAANGPGGGYIDSD